MRGQKNSSKIVSIFVGLLLLAALVAPTTATAHHKKGHGGTTTPPAPTGPKVLVLYDSTQEWAHVGELHAQMAANLVGHFGTATAKPVVNYVQGEMKAYDAVIYNGSTWDEPIPTAFLDDVIAETRPVIWVNRNIWQLASRVGFTEKYGWHWARFDEDDVQQVLYKGETLRRDANNPRGIMDYTILQESKIKVIAEAVRPDGSKFPWALKSENLTYIGESPFSYIGESDRYLIFADMLFDVLAPTTPERHRAMVRLEDVGCDADPDELRAIADYLASQRVPFSFGVYTWYKNPFGAENGGVAESIKLTDAACDPVVAAMKYMIAKGGTPLMHGYTHQVDGVAANPYNGKSGDDFEFYMAHVDELDYVRLDGPVPNDSARYVTDRVAAATAMFVKEKIPVPTIWEFPHYAASALDYRTIATKFSTVYERRLYFDNNLEGGTIDHSKLAGQFFPYVVKDIYGTKVLPENIGNIETESYNHHPVTMPDELIARARRNLVVRDGFASFFYHPHLGVELLKQSVEGIKGLGYTFVSPTSL
jgi:uncharacterized protein YdaL